MPQDAFTLNLIIKELRRKLSGGKISKITQPQKELLSFIVYTENGSVKLEICVSAKSCRINLAETEYPAPKTAPGFCMLLRKHLQNAKITDIGVIGGERIAYFDFDCTSEFELLKMRLYAEIMGKYSNCVLVKDGIILGALKTSAIGESTGRVLFAGAKYALPEAQDKLSQNDRAGIAAALSDCGGDIAKFISERVRGVSYSTALEIAETYGEGITSDDIVNYLGGEAYSPCVTFLNGKEKDFKVRSCEREKKPYPTLLQAQTAYYAAINARQAFEEKKKKLLSATNSAVKKLEKRLAVIEQKLFECKDMESVKLKGELITANLYAIKRGQSCFEAVNYYDEKGGTVKIDLDKTLSPADNAQRYYKKYAKLKRTALSVSAQKAEAKEKLDYLNSVISHIYAGECLSDFEETEEELGAIGLIKEQNAKKKTESKTPFRTFEKDGFTIFAGRNNLQNDRLLKRLSPQDIWLHTQKYHSSHVGILTDGKAVPDEVLLAAAEICAYYSDGRDGTKIPVDFVIRKQVKKPPKSNAGFVIYDGYNTMLVNPDAHAELRKD